MHFVVAYDIANPRRLRRVARLLEKRATRCQKSVFIFRGEVKELQALLDEVEPLLKVDEDIVQAWRIGNGSGDSGMSRGTTNNSFPAAVVIEPRQHRFINRAKP